MAEMYYIYSTKMQGWINKAGTYGSSLEEAKEFTSADAIELCRQRRDHNNAPTCFIVPTWFNLEMGARP